MSSVLGQSRNPDIRFFYDGRIDISSTISNELQMMEGDILDIWEEGEEQYLYIAHRADSIIGKHDSVCHQACSRGRTFRVWCTTLSRHILKVTGQPHVFSAYVGTPVELPSIGKAIPIITHNNINHD